MTENFFDPRNLTVLTSREAVRRRPNFYLRYDDDDGELEMLAQLVGDVIANYELLSVGVDHLRIETEADDVATIFVRGTDLSVNLLRSVSHFMRNQLVILGQDVPTGLFIVNALSDRLSAYLRVDDNLWEHLAFVHGEMIGEERERSISEYDLIVTFSPDQSLVMTRPITLDELRIRLEPIRAKYPKVDVRINHN